MIDLSQRTIFELLLKAFLLGVALGLLYDAMRLAKMLCGVSYDTKSLAEKVKNARTGARNNAAKARCEGISAEPQLEERSNSAEADKAKSSRAKAVLLYAVTFLFDLFFWVIFGISAVLLFYNVSGGVFRASVIPAMLFGLLVYYISLGRLVLYLNSRLVGLLWRLVHLLGLMIARLILKLCRFAAKILAVPLSFIKKILFSLYHLTIGKILGRIKEERRLRAQKKALGTEGEMPLCECDREGESEYGGKPYRSEGRISFGGRR